jgi:hypothetical protein
MTKPKSARARRPRVINSQSTYAAIDQDNWIHISVSTTKPIAIKSLAAWLTKASEYLKEKKRMRFDTFYTPLTWEIGLGFSFPAKGTANQKHITIRPWHFVLYLGPFTLELEGAGRCEVLR